MMELVIVSSAVVLSDAVVVVVSCCAVLDEHADRLFYFETPVAVFKGEANHVDIVILVDLEYILATFLDDNESGVACLRAVRVGNLLDRVGCGAIVVGLEFFIVSSGSDVHDVAGYHLLGCFINRHPR